MEPGFVKTSLVDNVPINGQGRSAEYHFALSDSEDETNTLLKTFLTKYLPVFMSQEETVLRVAEVIKDCIYQTKPPVRIQPGDAIREMAKGILIDHTGNQVTDEFAAFLK